MARLPVYDLNEYILDQMGSLLNYDGTGLRPIFPIQSVPEVEGRDAYLTYTKLTTSDPQMWWMSMDEVTYFVMHSDTSIGDAIVNELIDIFRRMDETAKDINIFNDNRGVKDFEYYSFRFMGTNSADPATQEGGLYMQPVSIRYSYSNNSGRGLS